MTLEMRSPRAINASPEAAKVADERARKHAIKRVLRVVKDHHGLDLDRFLEELARAAGVELTRDQ